MRGSDYDYEIGLAAWLLACASVYYVPVAVAVVLVVAATCNLLHQRHVVYRAGEQFQRRVRETLADDWSKVEARMSAMEKTVKDVKEAQTNIAVGLRKF